VTLAGLLADVIGLLDRSDVPYMVTGSVASSFHGEPRATRDLDIVIDPGRGAFERLVDGLLGAGYYVDRDAALDALRMRSQFNAIADDAGKVDFMLRRDRPFSIEEFGRRRPADLLGTPSFVASAEDTIIAKLEWAATTESERQLRDVAGMLAVGGDLLDRDYLERWVEALGLGQAWVEVRGPATGP
jgi:hypothetical protein